MTGLMALFRRHSGFMTNFRIFEVKSRPYWLQEGISECEESRCAEGLREPWSAWVDADTPVRALVGPWQYQCSRQDHGWVQYPVYHPPGTHLARTAWVLPSARHPHYARH